MPGANLNSWQKWKLWVARLQEQIFALYLASRDVRVNWAIKMFLMFIVAYALSPIDLIPDFVPVIGFLDEIIILPIAIAFAIRLIPQDIWQHCQAKAHNRLVSKLPSSRIAAAIIVMIWLAAAALIGFWFWQRVM